VMRKQLKNNIDANATLKEQFGRALIETLD
jgi:hypothetical protein